MQSAGSALSALMKELGMESALGLYRIKARWSGLFGRPLTLHSHPSGLHGGRLVINVDSPAWLQELSFLKDDMLGKLRPLGVNDIRFRLGRIETDASSGD